MESICCIMDFEGFHVNVKNGENVQKNQFLIREIGFVRTSRDVLHVPKSYSFDFNCFSWKDISSKDRFTIQFQETNIHGLSFYPIVNENPYNYSLVEDVIKACYKRSVHADKNVVAYKGGHCEKEMLDCLNIPNVDIELFGCPKFKELLLEKPDYSKLQCKLHICCSSEKDIHCPVAEVTAYRDWLFKKLYI